MTRQALRGLSLLFLFGILMLGYAILAQASETGQADEAAQDNAALDMLRATAEVHSSATLVRNTEHCGGDVPCEAIFTIDAAEQPLARNDTIIITFETHDAQALAAVPFTYDYAIGTMDTVTYPGVSWTCTNTTRDAQTNMTCEPTNVTLSRSGRDA